MISIASVFIVFTAGCAHVALVDEKNRGPVLIEAAVPVYPDEAKLKKVKGEVLVKMWVDERGRVTRAFVENTPDQSLTNAAMEAAMNSRFKPAMVDGKARGVWLIRSFLVVP
jgi:TonB family protein